MTIPASFTLKRNILVFIIFILIFMEVEASGSRPQSRNSRSVTPLTRIESRTSRLVRSVSGTSPRLYIPRNRSKALLRQSNSQQQFPQNVSAPHRPASSQSRPETLDVQTKLVLVLVSFFTLVFVVVLLIIGHFTWFAAIRKELEEEWQAELKKEEERRVAQNILSEMTNPFKNLEDADDGDGDIGTVEIRRRDSFDSNGCTRGLCVPPHHSILCPYNPNIPQLNEPFPLTTFDHPSTTDDLIEYRSAARRTTEWMNLESCVRISEPVPLRDRMMNYSMAFFSPPPTRPVTPLTPDPATPLALEIADNERDLELGKFGDSFDLKSSPSIKFDLSKLDLI